MLLDANIFQPLIDVFAAVLKFFHNNIGVSWGLSIILLTVVVRLFLMPLGIKQFHSMQRMAMHMPEIKKINVKYKENPQRKQQEVMAFYKENSINPFASCLPMLIQWPFLIGLFWTLRGNLRKDICEPIQKAYQATYATAHHISLHAAAGQSTTCRGKDGSSFLFIHDLTNNPHGVELVILLLLYIGTSIGSALIMMMPGTEKNQRYMMLGLPVIFAFITIRFPAGALLYYIIFNLWMVVQQSVFKRLIGKQYRHPAGEALGIEGDEGSISTGGGLAGLFGLRQGTDDSGDTSTPELTKTSEKRPTPKATGGRAGTNRRGGSTAAGEPKAAKPTGAKAKPKTAGGSSGGSKGSNGNGTSASSSRPPTSPRKRKKRSGRRR
jgi:YidC/Oxa1 family membrane protein insertase